MKLQNIGIRVLVKNFGECFEFYTEKLGFTVIWGDRNGPYASFGDDNRPCFAMFLLDNMTIYDGYEPVKHNCVGEQVVLSIPTDNVDADYEALKSKGVQFIGKPQTIADWYMRCVYFRDPAGNLFELCQDEMVE